MATIQMRDKCLSFIKEIETKMAELGRFCYFDFEGALELLGVVGFVDESELPKLSKADQCRHEKEDFFLRALYIKRESYPKGFFDKLGMIDAAH